ncbi:MAG TPA: methyl-accepting chemotaxis protein [Candidatus Avamphibacillus intestinigallinarum]|nr:methyl-accepting chemotaxis protein [Candidatus Avamphibacillus intestinigallinarum]
MKIKSISTKVSLVLLIVIVVVLATTGILVNVFTKSIVTDNIEKEVQLESEAVSSQVNHFFETKGQLVDQVLSNQTVLHFLNSAKGREDVLQNKYYKDMNASLEAVKGMDEDIAMVWVASEKGNFLTGTGDVLSDKDFDLQERPWYKAVHEADGLYFTEPYNDEVFGKVIMSVMKTVEVNDEVVGIVAADIFLDSIPSIMEQYKIGKTGYTILLDSKGNVIYHPNEDLVMNEPFTKQKGDLGKIAQKMIDGKQGLETAQIAKDPYYVGYEPVSAADWSVATTVKQDEVFKPLNSMTYKLIIFFTIAGVLLVAITYFLLKHMLKNIQPMSEMIKQIATGDLTQDLNIDSHDELGQVSNDLNDMLKHLREFIGVVQENSEQVAASSQQLNVSTDQTAEAAQVVAGTVDTVTQSTLQQIEKTKEASDTVSTMSDTFKSVALESDNVATHAVHAVEKAENGSEAVTSAKSQMEIINETVHATASIISKLGERSSEIGQIVDTISGISSQTNLLALNASIEASRAGESGKSFAVVANEVRKLAEQSNEAAEQIANLITEIQMDTEKAVHSIQAGTEEVEKGSEVVQTAGTTFTEITGIVEEVSEQINHISTSIQELSVGTEHIVTIIDDVDGLAHAAQEEFENVAAATEEQTATLEEIASASRSSSERALELQDEISKFNI